MILNQEASLMLEAGNGRLYTMGLNLGLSAATVKAVGKVTWTACQARLKWDWVGAGISAGTLDLPTMYEDYIVMTYAHLVDHDVPVNEAVLAVSREWGALQYKASNVHRLMVNGKREVYATAGIGGGGTGVEVAMDDSERGYNSMLSAIDAAAAWAKVRPYLTDNEVTYLAALADGETRVDAAAAIGKSAATGYRISHQVIERLTALGLHLVATHD